MWTILVSLGIGITIGILINVKRFIPKNFMKYNSKFQQAGVMLLLFSMGASIGSDKELLRNIQTIGLKAATFAIFTTGFSVIVTYIVTKNLFGEVPEK